MVSRKLLIPIAISILLGIPISMYLYLQGFSPSSPGEGKLILVDQSHGEDPLVTIGPYGFGEFLSILNSTGARIGILTNKSDLQKLELAKLLILICPKESFSRDEISAITSFVRKGGSLLIFVENRNFRNSSNVINELTEHFGIRVNQDVVLDDVNMAPDRLGVNRTWNIVTRVFSEDARSLFEGVQSLSFYSSASLEVKPPAKAIVWGSPFSWSELDEPSDLDFGIQNEDERSQPILVALYSNAGRVIVLGDTDIAMNIYILRHGNKRFLSNIIYWLLR